MNIIDEVLNQNKLKIPQNEVVQEFVVRVKITSNSNDPKILRTVLDEVSGILEGTSHKFDGGIASVTQVYAK